MFSDAALVRLWNEVQMEFAAETELLERVVNLSVPAIALYTYTHPWEEDYGGKACSVLYNFMSPFSYTQPWEIVQLIDEAPEVVGGFTSSQMWEGVYATVQNRMFHYLPDDALTIKYISYDQHPVDWIYREEVDGVNTSFKTRAGLQPTMYVEDSQSGLFYAYPRLDGVYGVTDIDTDLGEVVYDDASNNSINPDTDYGVIIFSSDTEIDSDYGLVVRAQTDNDAIQVIYTHTPIEVTASTQTIEWPRWCVKYIEFGVLSKLFKAETDIYNKSLTDFFTSRYKVSLDLIAKYQSNRYSMRTYQMQELSRGKGRGQKKLATLPSNYPSVRW